MLRADLSEQYIARTLKPSLSARETEVLTYMAQGATNRQIAEELTLTEGTVKLHVHNILKKLEVDGRTAAVSLALQTGLVKL